jgi:hypothetical protein
MRKYNYKIKPLMKIKTSIARVTMMLCLAMLTTMGAWAQYSGGDGSKEKPYIITTVNDLNNLAAASQIDEMDGKYFELGDDITFDNTQEVNFAGIYYFNGHFDGKGHTISGVRMKSERDVAFFINLSSAAEVKNLTLTDAVISSENEDYAGSICAFNSGRISNCHITSSVTINVSGSKTSVGGIACYNNYKAVVEGCTSAVTINATDENRYVAGIVAVNNGVVKNCLVYGGSLIGKPGWTAAVVAGNLYHNAAISIVTDNYYTLSMWLNNSPLSIEEGNIALIENGCDRSKVLDPNFAVVYDKEVPSIHDVEPDTTYAYDGIKKYPNGLVYKDKCYVRSEGYKVIENDGSDNISESDYGWKDVILHNRVLYKDGTWNTICLPFITSIYDGILDGAELRSLESASVEGSTLNLTFGEPDGLIFRGKPYIIRWQKPADYEGNERKYDIVNPVFASVEIVEGEENFDSGSGDTRVRFLGTYDALTFSQKEKKILFLGANNKLYYPDGETKATIGACRAYFKIGDDADTNNARRFTSININFGDTSTTTAINNSVEANTVKANNAWYTLDGRKLKAEPTHKGVYIYNGRVRVKK